MNATLYQEACQVSNSTQADALLAKCIENLRTMKGPIVPLSISEADRIARKNLVRAAIENGMEVGLAESLFGIADPLGDFSF